MQSYVQKQSAHIDTFPTGAEIWQAVFKRYKATFQGVQVVFSKKAFFRTTLLYIAHSENIAEREVSPLTLCTARCRSPHYRCGGAGPPHGSPARTQRPSCRVLSA